MEKRNKIVIFGAGKIGRGFIADIFNKQEYRITFVDANEEFVNDLNIRGKYTICSICDRNKLSETEITDFKALHFSNTNEIEKEVNQTSLIALCIFPEVFDSIAEELANIIHKRAEISPEIPLNILLCSNIAHPSEKFGEILYPKLSPQSLPYYSAQVGLIDTLVIRVAIEADAEMKAKDPNVVFTNGFPVLPLSQKAFKGELPNLSCLKWISDIRAEETRKLYTYNMIHAVLAYLGSAKNYTLIYESLQDPEIRMIAEKTLGEIAIGLRAEFGYTKEESVEWNNQVMQNFDSPLLKDTIARVGADPMRKLKRDDRLVGAALLCRRNGVYPYYLAKAIAHAFLFDSDRDNSSQKIKNYLKEHSIKEAVTNFCGVTEEVELVQLIHNHYNKALLGNELKENHDKIKILRDAYNLGFQNEKVFRGCAQCLLAGIFELTGQTESRIFQACSGFSGGIGLCGDGSCGGYTGGVLFMGAYLGRRYEQLDGDKIPQYKSYEMAQKLHDKYIETYGSSNCDGIHKTIYGQSYCLRTKPVRDAFEDAGAHRDKCTSVIAMASVWVTEILMEENYLWFRKNVINKKPGTLGDFEIYNEKIYC